MKKIILPICAGAALITVSAAFANNIFNPQPINSMNNSNNFATVTSNSSGYQRGQISLSSANRSQPHILKIESSANQLNGKIIVNGKVVKNLSNKTTKIDLSPYLSVGEHLVEISANYAPATSGIKVELNAPNNNLSQETSGNGGLNYQLEIYVRE